MDFFTRQDQARRRTRWLIAVFVLAVSLIAMAVSVVFTVLGQSLDGSFSLPAGRWWADNAAALAGFGAATAGFVVLASLFRHAQLRSGGSEVAVSLGGSPVLPEDRDPARRMFQNVVEETAIAASLPVPQVYVLEQESGINAFAAGHTPSDAAIAVTRGALERLTRDELQGVVGHEFSHILNGDMRLNLRLTGYLFGIFAVSSIGRYMMRSGSHRGIRLGKGGGASGIFGLAGLAVFLLGYAGILAGRLIQAAVSRQREFLADSAAVQFTRQTDGIAGALTKIAGLDRHSWLKAGRAEEVSHMLFAIGRKTFTSLMATHPPVEDRLRALGVRGVPPAGRQETAAAPRGGGNAAGFAPSMPVNALARRIGMPDESSRTFARELAEHTPTRFWEAVHATDLAVPALLALITDGDSAIRRRQLGIVSARLGKARAREVEQLAECLADTPAAERLALGDIAYPSIRRLPRARRDYLLATIDRLIEVDGEIDAFEAMLAGNIAGHLQELEVRRRIRPPDDHEQATAAVRLLAVLAIRGHEERTPAEAAFSLGLTALGDRWPVSTATQLPTRAPGSARLRAAIRTLDALTGADKHHLIEALAAAAGSDGTINGRELAMLRAICGGLHAPVPPVAEQAMKG